jgi:hypothetical protein
VKITVSRDITLACLLFVPIGAYTAATATDPNWRSFAIVIALANALCGASGIATWRRDGEIA